jgi:m7GpppX diphosphatase
MLKHWCPNSSSSVCSIKARSTQTSLTVVSASLTPSIDQAGRRIVLYGTILSKPAILILERAPFSSSPSYLSSLPSTLLSLKNLGANDIYFWYMASSGPSPTELHEDLKINLIYPSTDQHLKKYSKQGVRVVTETADIYREYVRPYMLQKREQGRLNWVWNIIDGKTEVEDVIYRTPKGQDVENGFLLLPDLNWDRKTMEGLHLLGLVERMDIWSLRDLRKKHVEWLKDMRSKILRATVETYPELEEDLLKVYVHYQPTYYHFHMHIVHVALEAGATQATGKAIGLESIISQLETMEGGGEAGMDVVALTYTIGEASELWTDILEPLKKNYRASQSQ